MKEQYRAYMDQVEVSPALHQRLIGLSAPRRPNRWRRYGSLAAALVVLIGVGAVGLGRLARERAGAELGETEPDIALEENPQEGAGEAGTIGGYEVTDGEVVSYFALPYIAYGPAPAGSTQVDYTLTAPAGSTRRAVTAEDVLTLVGGETALETHLGWGGLAWTGEGIFLSDGSLWHLSLLGEGTDLALSLEVMAGEELPPSCIVTEEDTVTDVGGIPVKGYTGGIYGKTDDSTGETVLWLPESRTVEFAANGAGYRFQGYVPEGEEEQAGLLASQFVRLAIADGLNLSMTQEEPVSQEEPGGDRADSPAYDPAA